jgi:predicted amidohydrolase YtcJ
MSRIEVHLLCAFLLAWNVAAVEADLILHGGKVATVDKNFSIHSAIGIAEGKVLLVGDDAMVLKLKGAKTEVVDLRGKLLIPGLMDSHVHPGSASLTEFDHPIPDMESVQDVLDYLARRAKALKPGEWIVLQQVFITRLKEQRYPTRAEMDRVAPENPVVFRTGPDASLNSLALKLSGMYRDFKVSDGGPGFIEKDAAGELTGILRNCSRFVKSQPSTRTPTIDEKRKRMIELFKDYSSVGLTTVCDRDANPDVVELYKVMREKKELTLRVSISQDVPYIGALEQIQERIRDIAKDPLFKEKDEWLRGCGSSASKHTWMAAC